MEQLHRLIHYSPTGKVFNEMLTDLTPPGSPVYDIPRPKDLGYPERKDTDTTLTPSQINEAIFLEGARLAGTEVIDIGNNKELFVFNTSVASTHTVLSVNYQEWEWALRKNAAEINIEVPKGPLIQGTGHTDEKPRVPSLVPLDMVTWVMVRDHNNNTYMPCDVNDLTSLPTGNSDIDRHKLHLNEEKLQEVYSAISKRNRLSIGTMLDLHNNVLCQEIPFLKKIKEEDLLIGCLSGYYRGDDAKQLKQHEFDHRGKGPMSNPTLHFRVTDHFTMEEANLLDQANPSISFKKSIALLHERYPSYFAGSIDFAEIKPEILSNETEGTVLQKFMKDKRFSLYDLIKTIDPYASLAHDHLSGWLQEELNSLFLDIPHTKELFAHHTSDYERELRVSEGASMTVEIDAIDDSSKDLIMAECFTRISQWIGKRLYPMWDSINVIVQQKAILSPEEVDSQINTVLDTFNLPESMKEVISQLKPTEKQLKLLRNDIENNWSDPDRQSKLQIVNKKLHRYMKRKLRNSQVISAAENKLASGTGTFEDLVGLLTLIQSSQIYDNEGLSSEIPKLNDGYNIPGVPGTAITYSYGENNKLNIKIGWLLSTKGLSELWLGSIMKRTERRDR